MWGKTAALATREDLLSQSQTHLLGLISSAIVGKQRSTRKEIVAKVFHIVVKEDGARHTRYRAEFPFLQSPRSYTGSVST